MAGSKSCDISLLWSLRENENYEYITSLSRGRFGEVVLFWDVPRSREVGGKVVKEVKEGEGFHWPSLAHVNLLSLTNVIDLSDQSRVFISPWYDNTLYEVINRNEFYNDPGALDKKKRYVEGVLWGLDHIHKKRLCLVNLHEENILVCQKTNTAVIGNFSSLLPLDKVDSKKFLDGCWYVPPEVLQHRGESEGFNGMAADIWTCGIMILSVFCGPFASRFLANSYTFEDVMSSDQRLQSLVSQEILAKANPNSAVTDGVAVSFKCFLYQLLANDPKCRTSADCAALDYFLRDTCVKSVTARFESNIKSKVAHTARCDCFQHDDSVNIIHRGAHTVRDGLFREITPLSTSVVSVKMEKQGNTQNCFANLKMDDPCSGDVSFDANSTLNSYTPPTADELGERETEVASEQIFSCSSLISLDKNTGTDNEREIISDVAIPVQEFSLEVESLPDQPMENASIYSEVLNDGAKANNQGETSSTGFLNSLLDHTNEDVQRVIDRSFSEEVIICEEETEHSYCNDANQAKYSSPEEVIINDTSSDEVGDSVNIPDLNDFAVLQNLQPGDAVETLLVAQSFVSKEHLSHLEPQVTKSDVSLIRRNSYREAISKGVIDYLQCGNEKSIPEWGSVEIYDNPEFSISSLFTDRDNSPDYECSNAMKLPAKGQYDAPAKCPQKRHFWRRWNKLNFSKSMECGIMRKTDSSALGSNHDLPGREGRKSKSKLGKKKKTRVMEKVDIVLDLPEEINSRLPSDSPESLLLNVSFANHTLKEKRRKIPRIFVLCQ